MAAQLDGEIREAMAMSDRVRSVDEVIKTSNPNIHNETKLFTRTQTLNPQPSTLNPQPSTLDPQPLTLNP